jgi:hypothetical protein
MVKAEPGRGATPELPYSLESFRMGQPPHVRRLENLVQLDEMRFSQYTIKSPKSNKVFCAIMIKSANVEPVSLAGRVLDL